MDEELAKIMGKQLMRFKARNDHRHSDAGIKTSDILCYCFIVLAGVFYLSVSWAAVPSTGIESALSGNKDKPQLPAANSSNLSRPTVEYRAEGLKDPFKGVQREDASAQKGNVPTQDKPLPPLRVSGIIWGGAFPQAIINQKVVKVGDVLDSEVKVVDITKDGVTVFFNYKNYNLSTPASTMSLKGSPTK